MILLMLVALLLTPIPALGQTQQALDIQAIIRIHLTIFVIFHHAAIALWRRRRLGH